MRRAALGDGVPLGFLLSLALCLTLGPTPARAAPPEAGPRFQVLAVAGGNQILDSQTNLVWQRCSAGQTWQGGRCRGAPKLLALAAARRAPDPGREGWRLPTLGELTRFQAARSPLFPLPAPFVEGGRPYWTQTRVPDLPPLVYCVDLGDGSMDAHSPGISLGVRWVRQALPEELGRQSPDRQ